MQKRRLVIFSLALGGMFLARASVGQQQEPTMLLLPMIKRADEIRVYLRDPKNPTVWQKKPKLNPKVKSSPSFFQSLRGADLTKSGGLDPKTVKWQFEFFDWTAKDAKLGTAFSDGAILERRGDAAVMLPPDWVKKLK